MGEGDTGPNTGGMGAYSPAPAVTPQIQEQVMQDIVQCTADALVAEGCPYRGVLFAGLMIKDGKVSLTSVHHCIHTTIEKFGVYSLTCNCKAHLLCSSSETSLMCLWVSKSLQRFRHSRNCAISCATQVFAAVQSQPNA